MRLLQDSANLRFKQQTKSSFCMQKTLLATIIFDSRDLLVVAKKRPASLQNIIIFLRQNNFVLPTTNLILVDYYDDQNTGLLLFAKKEKVAVKVAQLFRNKQVYKESSALLHGKIDKKMRKIEFPIKNKAATTKLISAYHIRNYSLVHLLQPTHRKDQLCSHLAAAGYPILGDKKYGQSYISNNLMLHCKRLKFSYKNEVYNFLSAEPSFFTSFLRKMGYMMLKVK